MEPDESILKPGGNFGMRLGQCCWRTDEKMRQCRFCWRTYEEPDSVRQCRLCWWTCEESDSKLVDGRMKKCVSADHLCKTVPYMGEIYEEV